MIPPEPSPTPIVHVIDDDEEVCWAIETLLLSSHLPARCWSSAVDFLAALPTLAPACIGCVLTDVRMPGMDGIALLQALAEGGFPRPVLVMTSHGDIALAVRAMKLGAFEFIEKPFEEEVLLGAVRAALNLSGRDGRSPVEHRPEIATAAARIATLSPREREVLDLAMEGKSSKVIAHELGLSARTVEVHRLRLMARLGVGSLAEAVRMSVLAELAGQR